MTCGRFDPGPGLVGVICFGLAALPEICNQINSCV